MIVLFYTILLFGSVLCGTERDMVSYRFCNEDGDMVTKDGALTSGGDNEGDTAGFKPPRFITELLDTAYISMAYTQDTYGPDARASWSDKNDTICVAYFENWFHNKKGAYTCLDKGEFVTLRYGEDCAAWDPLGRCQQGRRECFMVVNGASKQGLVSVGLMAVLVVLVALL